MDSYQERTLDKSKEVWVHRNLNNGRLSVLQNDLVVAHTDQVNLEDVRFHINQGKYRECIRKHQKTVHAYAIGKLVDQEADGPEIHYNPYDGPHFTRASGERLETVDHLTIKASGEMRGK